jgi:hypothetical protein
MAKKPANGLNPTEYLQWRKSNLRWEEFLRRKNTGDPAYRYDGEYSYSDEYEMGRITRSVNGFVSAFDNIQSDISSSEKVVTE